MHMKGLTEAITYKHGQDPPETYYRGSHSIDGIFMSQYFLGVKGGYLEYGKCPGDHRGIWVDIPQELFLGYRVPNIPISKIRRLNCQDPRTVSKYQETLHKIYCNQRIYNRIYDLREAAKAGWTPTLGLEFNAIDNIMVSGMETAQQSCWKVFVGGREF